MLTLLSWLRKAFGTPAATEPTLASVAHLGHGSFNFEVVGEQSYQSALRNVSAGRVERGERVTVACCLRYEINSHTHDPAVRVDTSSGRTIGYFPADQAAVHASAIHKLELDGDTAACQGVLVGGQPDKPSFGVWLDFKAKVLHAKAG